MPISSAAKPVEKRSNKGIQFRYNRMSMNIGQTKIFASVPRPKLSPQK